MRLLMALWLQEHMRLEHCGYMSNAFTYGIVVRREKALKALWLQEQMRLLTAL